MKTTSIKKSDVEKNWVLMDAQEQQLGRLASEVARLLRGKHKPTFTPHIDGGDYVIIVNAEKVQLTGDKWQKKMYYRHSGYVGGLKSFKAQDILNKRPERLLQLAVKGMLPRNKMRSKLLKHLKVYCGPEHPHAAQKPVAPPPRLASSTPIKATDAFQGSTPQQQPVSRGTTPPQDHHEPQLSGAHTSAAETTESSSPSAASLAQAPGDQPPEAQMQTSPPASTQAAQRAADKNQPQNKASQEEPSQDAAVTSS